MQLPLPPLAEWVTPPVKGALPAAVWGHCMAAKDGARRQELLCRGGAVGRPARHLLQIFGSRFLRTQASVAAMRVYYLQCRSFC